MVNTVARVTTTQRTRDDIMTLLPALERCPSQHCADQLPR